ncbi:hypothetical protein RI367_001457 [Sorochytrium milnesiophthora]
MTNPTQAEGQPQQSQQPLQPRQQTERPLEGQQLQERQLVDLSQKESPLVPRPGLCNAGRPCPVFANHFAIVELPHSVVHHYDVIFLRRKIFTYLVKKEAKAFNNGLVIYDGMRNVFAANKLPDDLTFVVDLSQPLDPGSGPSEPRAEPRPPRRDEGGAGGGMKRKRGEDKFTVTLKPVAQIQMNCLAEYMEAKGAVPLSNEVIMAMTVVNVALNHSPLLKMVPVIRGASASFFSRPNNPPRLSGGIEVWHGFFQSARLGSRNVMINVDQATCCFHQEISIAQFIGDHWGIGPDELRRRPLDSRQKRELLRILKNLQFRLHYVRSKPKKKVFEFSEVSAAQIKFEMEGQDGEKTETTVAQYYAQKYNIRLQFPDLPCVVLRNKTAIPFELCILEPGQRYMPQLQAKQLAEIIKLTACKPQERKKRVEDEFSKLNYNSDPTIREFGIKVARDMVRINAHILDCPMLGYGNRKEVQPRSGEWNMRNTSVLRGVSIKYFGVVNFATRGRFQLDERKARDILVSMIRTMEDTGLKFESFPVVQGDDSLQSIEPCLRRIVDMMQGKYERKPTIIFVILPDKSTQRYAEIKAVGEVMLSIPTQCMQAEKLVNPRGMAQYAANIALKVNVKAIPRANPGKNVTVLNRGPFFNSPVMIMGADVSHPGAGSSSPSLAALTASVDEHISRYVSICRTQPTRLEEIVDMEAMATEALNMFGRHNKCLPEKIVMFRDGVGEGNFVRMRHTEMLAIKQAAAKIGKTQGVAGEVKITYVVVSKRHHTRFFAANREDTDRSGNVMPGLVVDSEITHPNGFDFYLQSQAGLLGTSRPVHYHVIHDENNFTVDNLVSLTYNLCFTFARATRSVSIVPPVYYADLVANRARIHMRGGVDSSDSASHGGSSSGAAAGPPPVPVLKPDIVQSMYFM